MIRKTLRKLIAASLLWFAIAAVPWSAAEASPRDWSAMPGSAQVTEALGWWSKLWQQLETWWGPGTEQATSWEKGGGSGGGSSQPTLPGSTGNAGGGTDPDG